jgi:hypothetical protein
MTNQQIREQLLNSGVKNLKEFGYKEVNITNILKDEVYRLFFFSILKSNIGNDKQVDEVIKVLLLEII